MESEYYAVITSVSLDFPEKMILHLGKHFPFYCEQLGEETTYQAVLEGVERAAEYEIFGDVPVCLFIDLLFAFGPTFDSEDEFSWTQEILRDYTLDPAAKMRKLYAIARKGWLSSRCA